MSNDYKQALSKAEGLIPKLRFPEFKNEGEWETKEVGEIFDVTRGYVLAMSLVQEKKSDENPYPVYSSQTKNNGLAGFYKEYLYEDAITWTTDGANAGDVNYREGKFYCTNVCGVLLNKDGFANKCISELINSVSKNYVSYVGNPKLMNGVMSLIKIPVPKIKEQQKIDSCLSSLDELIAAHSQKLELLKDHKKGLMQNLFPQEGEKVPKVRFKEFEKDGEWVEKKLREVANNVMYGMNAAATVFDGKNIYLRITDIDENSRLISSKSLTSPNGILEDKYLLNEGDLVFARTGASVGKSYLHQNNIGKVYFAGFLIRFSIKDNIPYFIYSQTLTEQYQQWVSKTSMRSGQPGINAEEYKLFTFFIPPTIQEQQKIASCLSSLDALITAQAEKVEQLKLHKKGLMQGLFPKIDN